MYFRTLPSHGDRTIQNLHRWLIAWNTVDFLSYYLEWQSPMTNNIFQIDRKPPAFCPAISQWDLPFRIFPPRGLLGPTGDTTMVVGKFWRPNMGNCISNFRMCKHFSHFSHFGPFKTQAKCNLIRAYCLNLVPENAPVHIGRNIKKTKRDDFLNAAFTLGNAQRDAEG